MKLAPKHVGRRARFQQHGDASCHQVSFFLQGKSPKEIHAILIETLAGFLPGQAKDLSVPLYIFRELALSRVRSRVFVNMVDGFSVFLESKIL